MKLICSHMSAIWYWYGHGPEALLAAPVSGITTLDQTVATPPAFDKFDLRGAGIEPPPMSLLGATPGGSGIDVLVRENVGSRVPEGFRVHRWRGEVPPGSMRVVSRGIHVCTPELAFVQLATSLSEVRLIRLGLSLCSNYWLEPEHGHVVRRQALAKKSRIAHLIGCCGRRAGSGRYGRALKLIADGAASPREIALYMLCCLPPRLGGYGLGGAELNHSFHVEDEEMCLLDRPDRLDVIPDLWWPGTNVCVEYLGHDHDVQVEEDRRRQNLSCAMGYRSFLVDSSQMSDPVAFDATMHQVAWTLGRELPARTDAWLEARGQLRELLLGRGQMRL